MPSSSRQKRPLTDPLTCYEPAIVGHHKPSTIARVLALFAQVVDADMRRLDLHLPARQSPTIASYVRAADKKRQPIDPNPARHVARTCVCGTRLGKRPGKSRANTVDQVIVMPSLKCLLALALVSGFAAESTEDCSSCGYEPSSQGLSLNRSHRKMLY